MDGIADFLKVSLSQFLEDSKKTGFIDDQTPLEVVETTLERLKFPHRATRGSAGYDFFLPYSFFVSPGKQITIPTGFKVNIKPGWFLGLVPRSGLGFKYGMRLLNSFGVIDEDYIHADNEGHIMAKITVESNMCLKEGDRFMQGVFFQYGTTKQDETLGTDRTGGFGSTGA